MNQSEAPEVGEEEMPERMCIVTRMVMEKDMLIRFVADPKGMVVPDLRCNLPGRGVWVGASRSRVSEAVKRQLFSRGLKARVEADAHLAERVEVLLRKQALGTLALANKAGLVLAGHDKVDEAAGKGRLRLLVEASDGAVKGLERIRRKAKALCPGMEVVSCFTSAELGLALGRTNVIHAAVMAGGLTQKLGEDVRRVMAYGQEPVGS